MQQKFICIFALTITLISSNKAFGAELEKTSPIFFSFGASYLTNEAFDGLSGSGKTVDGNDDATFVSIGYNASKNISITTGILNINETTSTLYSGAYGKLHGKTFSVSQGCNQCQIGAGNGNLDLKAEYERSYMLGFNFKSPIFNNFAVFFDTGILFWDVSYSANGAQFTYDDIPKSGRFLEIDGNDAYFSLGSSYRINMDSSMNLSYFESEIHNSKISGAKLSWLQKF